MGLPVAVAVGTMYAVPTAMLAFGFLVEYLRPDKNRDLESECNIFQGRWVFDAHHVPLYTPQSCPFITKKFDCQNNGRPDNDYMKYRWNPYSCMLPRFHGEDFLIRFEGKRIMFVGDSVGYNQWLSLACMLHSAVPQHKYVLHTKGGLPTITFPAYNVSLMFYPDDFLVDIAVGGKNERILKLDSIGNGGVVWKDADVLVFNTWNGWLQTGKKQSWDVIQEANARHNDMDPLVAYEKALNTWAKWVNSTVDTNKTMIFFQGVSPDHFNSRDWADPNAKNCKRQTRPVPGHRYPGGPHPAEAVLERALGSVSESVYLVNVTALSQLRKDGHPSIYGSKDVDCTHWCLPGLPDAWNELLYATILGY
ncbi:protein trichome birefringence-like 43 [Durio zibethinus]|uniref:Protein trichome birefringence-like 43 n=1 Tax=Durio zibethinus TaxID=66656 RepID=A0A6P5Y6U3_DURZI|nr:protein trichome birefringence-like 43 [Durio zibethinus]